MNKITILGYHDIDSEGSLSEIERERYVYTIGQENFKQQLSCLSDEGYNGILIDNYIKHKTQNLQYSRLDKSIILTFDDGHITNYTHAFSLLKESNYVATFFITINRVGTSSGMTWRQLREMADNGMSIQSHTISHPFLSDISCQEIRLELQNSKLILEQNLGRAVDYLALPGGRCNSAVKQIAMEVGYRALCTSIVGYNDASTEPYSLRRWVVRRDMKLSTFNNIIHNKSSTLSYYRTRYFLLAGMKRVLGNQFYAYIHKRFSPINM